MLPRDRGLECVGDDALSDQLFPGVGHPDKGVTPDSRCSLAMCVRLCRIFERAAIIGAALQRPGHPCVERMIAGLESQHEYRRRAVARSGVLSLLRIEYTTVRGIEPGLGDRSDGSRGREKVRKSNCTAGAEAWSILKTHPRLRDHPQNAFRADEKSVGAGARAGAGNAAALEPTAGGHNPQALDQFIHVSVEGSEMAA